MDIKILKELLSDSKTTMAPCLGCQKPVEVIWPFKKCAFCPDCLRSSMELKEVDSGH